jgi:hypothetical protein
VTATDPIAAVREEDATGETAAIFADLRATLGVPFVNLIWRHLATIPGGLAPTWAVVKPLYATGRLRDELPRLREAIALPDIVAIPDETWDCAGLGPAEREAIATLIGDYNQANGVNFLALLVAVALLRDEAPPTRGASTITPKSRPAPTTPPRVSPRLLGLSELPPAVLWVVRDLDTYGRLGQNDAIASLYRHLGHWPIFLAVAHAALGPDHRSGALQRAQERVIATGRAQALELAATVPAGSPLPTGVAKQQVLASLDEFTRLMIGRMVVMGHAMASLLPSRARHDSLKVRE